MRKDADATRVLRRLPNRVGCRLGRPPATLLGWIATVLVGCGATTRSPPAEIQPERGFEREGVSTISVLMPSDERLTPLVEQLRHELSEDFALVVVPIRRSGGEPHAVAQALKVRPPRAVVLVNNTSVLAYRSWARSVESPPVAIILLSSFADQLQPTVPNSVGIAYEVPAVTSLVGLRTLGKAVRRTGVVYRAALSQYVSAQRALAKAEGIEFVCEVLEAPVSVQRLKAALVRLRRAGVDVLWLPNDNALLTPQLLTRAWLPYVKRLKLPVVVGVPSLVSSRANFGIFGAIPDLEGLAVQAADLIYELQSQNWSVAGAPVQLPLSTQTYVSTALGRQHGLSPGYSDQVDVVVGPLQVAP